MAEKNLEEELENIKRDMNKIARTYSKIAESIIDIYKKIEEVYAILTKNEEFKENILKIIKYQNETIGTLLSSKCKKPTDKDTNYYI